MVAITMRRVFRVLYCLVAAGTLAGLPVLIIDFKNHDWSVHYKVRAKHWGFRLMRSEVVAKTAVYFSLQMQCELFQRLCDCHRCACG
jgi:hypothetical protein